MGAYVNVSGESKKEWLDREGEFLSLKQIDYDALPENTLPVILIDNGQFTAAGIAFSKQEFGVFTDPEDKRPKWFYLVSIDKLHTVSPSLKDYLASVT